MNGLPVHISDEKLLPQNEMSAAPLALRWALRCQPRPARKPRVVVGCPSTGTASCSQSDRICRRRNAVSRLDDRSIDLAYRPRTYFWPHGLKPHPLSSIKGANRRAFVARALAEDPDQDIPPVLLRHALPAPLRSAF